MTTDTKWEYLRERVEVQASQTQYTPFTLDLSPKAVTTQFSQICITYFQFKRLQG